MFWSIFNEANEPSSACRLWRISMVETSTPPAEESQYRLSCPPVKRCSMVLLVVADHIDDDGAGEQEDVVFAGGNFDAVGVGPGEPAFGAGGDDAAGAGELVFVVEKISLGLEVIGAGDVHDEFAFEEGEQFFLDDGGEVSVAMDFVFGSPGEKTLLDEGEFAALHVLEGKFVADGEDFAVDEKAIGAGFVFDDEVVAEAEYLLLHYVAHVGSIAGMKGWIDYKERLRFVTVEG